VFAKYRETARKTQRSSLAVSRYFAKTQSELRCVLSDRLSYRTQRSSLCVFAKYRETARELRCVFLALARGSATPPYAVFLPSRGSTRRRVGRHGDRGRPPEWRRARAWRSPLPQSPQTVRAYNTTP